MSLQIEIICIFSGYYLPNTPNLDALNEKGEISVFRDVVSPHSTTIAVLSKLFTFCNRESDQEWYHYNNLIDVMNAAGYKTHWLSNQETSGVWGNVAQIYAAHSDVSAFTRIRDSREDYGIVDGELFPLIDDAIANRSEDKNFYVVHLMGDMDYIIIVSLIVLVNLVKMISIYQLQMVKKKS